MELIFLSLLLGVGAVVGLLGGGDSDDDGPANAGDDTIIGTALADRIEAGAGNDVVNSLEGDDQLFLGVGDDTANAGPGEDRIFGGGGKDDVQGGPGNDTISLDGGNDRSVGVDLGGIPQDGGDDTIRGGPANDVILDRFGTNRLFGDEGADTLNAVDDSGDNTPDELSGGFGTDTLIGDDGDQFAGNDGLDAFTGAFDEIGEDPVRISDFDTANETLRLQFEDATFAPVSNADLSFNTLNAPDRVEVLVNGTVYAVLEGATAPPANVTVEMV
ncbi:MAG: hypothetical protein AAGJ74_00935 [Pseudomonadota bacterium]